MIREITNPLELPKILELAKNVPNTPPGRLKGMIENSFGAKTTRLIAYDIKDEVAGFAYATIEEIDGEDVVFLQTTYIKPGSPKNVGPELLADLRKWGARRAIEWVYALTNREEKALMRKYRFEYVSTLMRRKV